MSDRRGTWLLPTLAPVCSAAVRVFYRFQALGDPPPAGPVLFVANHPNSIVDAIVVAATVGRPIRFLAKATLFDEPGLGALIRAGGAIPVYRRQDDPALTERNARVFEAVHEALASGDAVGIFPEGLSHSEPSLTRLRTGAARISLGASERKGIHFPIVPVGIVARQKQTFRSECAALVGQPVPWDDLAGRSESDVEAVRELTDRIERGLRSVTVNVEQFEDRRIVECAEAIFASEQKLDTSQETRVRRLREASESLARLRETRPEAVDRLFADVESFAWTLDVLGIRPRDLDRTARLHSTAGWFLRVFGLLFVGGPISAVGHVVFFIPYRLTDWIATRPQIRLERQSTWKLLGGAVLHISWIALISLAVGILIGPRWAVFTAVCLPLLAIATQVVRDRWRQARKQARRYMLLRRKGRVRERLVEQRGRLARSLEELRRAARPGPGDPPQP
ncbi:MAG: 1-acyl-sn-glycerol-3-phosphate acyltransferase [marine benthic group bacterium]|nr:1-acyl-sn-glycerol-3-phosphate acyltransferase [Gemmatimonadota bacterium]